MPRVGPLTHFGQLLVAHSFVIVLHRRAITLFVQKKESEPTSKSTNQPNRPTNQQGT